LLDGVPGDQVDEEEDKAYDQPDDGQGVDDALEDVSQFSVLIATFVILSGTSSNELA
jgi:hypothetical protein